MIKVTKFGEDWLNGYGAMEENLVIGHFTHSPGLNRVKGCVLGETAHVELD